MTTTTRTIETVYYYEHPTDESRYLRITSARECATLVGVGELGVIVDPGGDAPLRVRAVVSADERVSQREAARRLVAAAREMAG